MKKIDYSKENGCATMFFAFIITVLLILFLPDRGVSQARPKKDSACLKCWPKIEPIPDSVASVSIQEYAQDVDYFYSYLGKLSQDTYEKLTPKETMQQFWRFVQQKRLKK